MNRKNEGDFFDGLPANYYIEEDIAKDFGNPEETLLREVLYYIEHDSFNHAGVKNAHSAGAIQWNFISHSGDI